MTAIQEIDLALRHALRHAVAAMFSNLCGRHTDALAHLRELRADTNDALRLTRKLAELEAQT